MSFLSSVLDVLEPPRPRANNDKAASLTPVSSAMIDDEMSFLFFSRDKSQIVVEDKKITKEDVAIR
jgi:hypothetical protein